MVSGTLDWKDDLERWLRPFVDRLRHKSRRRMCPLYVSGLIGPGDRKSIQPMARRLALGECDQLHHFIAAGVWDAAPVETELLVQADRLVGGSDAMLVIDDTAIPTEAPRISGTPLRDFCSHRIPRKALTLATQNLFSTAFLSAFSASFRKHWAQRLQSVRHERFQMTSSLIGADRNTHLKTIAVAVAAAMLVVIFGVHCTISQ